MATKRANAVARSLQAAGVSSVWDLSRATSFSQPSISLAIGELGDEIVRFGKARASRYGLVRRIAEEGSQWLLYSINQTGLPNLAGQIVALHQGEWVFQSEPDFEWINMRDYSQGLYPGLPWFLDTLRPQGFLGRNFGKAVSPSLGLPMDPGDWLADHVLIAAIHYGFDFPGSFVMGDKALEKVQSAFLQETTLVASKERRTHYHECAIAALAGEIPGSSAGGEQPKFTTALADDGEIINVIVKFSGPTDSPIDQRWRDLLIAESIASEILKASQVPVVNNHIFNIQGRVFLESERIDRVGEFGRRFVVPLSALDGAFYGQADTPWRQAADRLEKDCLFSNLDADNLRWLWWFGNLIGNDDMHYGNISLFSNGSGSFELAPCYDMLPMRYRPSNSGELVPREPNPSPPPPQALDVWRRASLASANFWQSVKDRTEVSQDFKNIADVNLRSIEKLRVRFA